MRGKTTFLSWASVWVCMLRWSSTHATFVALPGAHSTEMQPRTPHPVVALITEWQNADGSTQQRDESSDMGGTMRLGAQPCHLVEGTRTREVYGTQVDVVSERHRHRYEINDNYVRAGCTDTRHGNRRLVR
jgi:CTP synthase (UTP-ammonia lyase)